MRLQGLAARRSAVTAQTGRSGPGMGPILPAVSAGERPRLHTAAMLGACGGWIMGLWVCRCGAAMTGRAAPVIMLRTQQNMVSACPTTCEKHGQRRSPGNCGDHVSRSSPPKIREAAEILLRGGASSTSLEIGSPHPTPAESWVRQCTTQHLHSEPKSYVLEQFLTSPF